MEKPSFYDQEIQSLPFFLRYYDRDALRHENNSPSRGRSGHIFMTKYSSLCKVHSSLKPISKVLHYDEMC